MPIMGQTAKDFLAKHGITDTPCYTHFGEGWHKLLDKLLVELFAEGVKPEDVHQIKEKWGGLCVYLAHGVLTNPIRRLIKEAEDVSLKTCDICGDPGTFIREAWVRTRCEKHRNSMDDRWPEELRNV